MDCDGDPETVVPRSALLDNLMLYWLPATGASSARLYWESIADVNARAGRRDAGPDRRPDRVLDLPGRAAAQLPPLGAAALPQHPPLGRAAARRSLRGLRAAGAVRRRDASRVPRCVDRSLHGHGAVRARAGQPGRLEREGGRRRRAGRAPVGDATRSPGASGTFPRAQVGALPDVDGKDVVELGCGTAYVSAWLAARGARPVGDRRVREPARHRPRDAGQARARVPAAPRERGGRAAARRLRGLRDQRVRREPVVRSGRVARGGGAAVASRRRPRLPHELAAGDPVRAGRGRGDATGCCATSAG